MILRLRRVAQVVDHDRHGQLAAVAQLAHGQLVPAAGVDQRSTLRWIAFGSARRVRRPSLSSVMIWLVTSLSCCVPCQRSSHSSSGRRPCAPRRPARTRRGLAPAWSFFARMFCPSACGEVVAGDLGVVPEVLDGVAELLDRSAAARGGGLTGLTRRGCGGVGRRCAGGGAAARCGVGAGACGAGAARVGRQAQVRCGARRVRVPRRAAAGGSRMGAARVRRHRAQAPARQRPAVGGRGRASWAKLEAGGKTTAAHASARTAKRAGQARHGDGLQRC